MGRKPSVQVYAEQEILDAMEQHAEQHDRSVSATWREAARHYLEETEP